MKTLKEWDEVGGTFDEYVTVGDIIDDALYDHFLGVVPPAAYGKKGYLMGEPMSTDVSTGEYIFMAFGQSEEYCSYLGHMTLSDFRKYDGGK
jgi:hypothetical protein